MQAIGRHVKGIADEFVKLVILLILDFIFALGPQGLHGINRVALHLDGKGNEVRVLGDDLFNGLLIGKFMGVILEFDYYLGTATDTFCRC